VQVVVLGDLSHVVVEPPTVRVLLVGDAGELALHHGTLVVGRTAPMDSQHGHRDVARVAVEDDESKRLIVNGVPLRRVCQLTQLATFHRFDAAEPAVFPLAAWNDGEPSSALRSS
jgi:hypothetical protein